MFVDGAPHIDIDDDEEEKMFFSAVSCTTFCLLGELMTRLIRLEWEEEIFVLNGS
jgi:hypothetical protein